MEEKLSCISIVTCDAHKEKLERCVADLAISVHVFTCEEDSTDNLLKNSKALNSDVLVIDEFAIDKDEQELKSLIVNLGFLPQCGCRIVFITAPETIKSDTLIQELLSRGVTGIVSLRYLDSFNEARKAIRKAITSDVSTEEITDLLESYPDEPKKRLFGKSEERIVDDVLLAEEHEKEEMEELDEAELVKAMFANDTVTNDEEQEESLPTPTVDEILNNEEDLSVFKEDVVGERSEHQDDASFKLTEVLEEPQVDATEHQGDAQTITRKSLNVAETCNQVVAAKPINFDELDPINKAYLDYLFSQYISTIKTNGVENQEYIVVGDAPGVGTTHVALSLAMSIAENEKDMDVYFVPTPGDRLAEYVKGFNVSTIKHVKIIDSSEAQTVRNGFANVIVYDYGTISQALKAPDITIRSAIAKKVVCVYSGNPWDINRIKELLFNLVQLNTFDNLVLASNHTPVQTKEALKQVLDVQGKTTVSYFEVPRCPNFLEEESRINNAYKSIYATNKAKTSRSKKAANEVK